MNRLLLCLASVATVLPATIGAGEIPVPNGSFEEGQLGPTGWTLNGGVGGLCEPGAEGRRAISVTGDGTSDNAWISAPLPLAPSTLYRLQFQTRRVSGRGGLAVSGPLCCNRDLASVPEQWSRYTSYFLTPSPADSDVLRLRFGQWQLSGQVAFDDVRVDRVLPIYSRLGNVELGEGETIREGQYTFQAPFGQASANHARPLVEQQCQFNSNRWVFSEPDSVVTYRHRVGPTQLGATIQAEVGWYQRGALVVEASRDGQQWLQCGTVTQTGSGSFPVPGELFPAAEIWVRFTVRRQDGETGPAALQLIDYQYAAALEQPAANLVGTTRFLAVTRDDAQLEVAARGLGDAIPGGSNAVDLQLTNRADRPLKLELEMSVSAAAAATEPASATRQTVVVPAGAQPMVNIAVPYELTAVGQHRLALSVSGDASFAAETSIEVHALHATSYGELLPGSVAELGLWWCSSGWKISVQRPLPTKPGNAVVIAAAANEAEAAQLVLRPQQPISNLRVQVSDLMGPQGRQIAASHVDLLRVGYVEVTRPTDATSTVGMWPDPLPPLREPQQLAAGRNWPLWVRVRVPKGQQPGTYRGMLTLQADGLRRVVPLQVEVFGFELPDRMTCRTAFGFDPSLVWSYHRLDTEQQRRAVLEKYFRCLAAHHISPYQPAPLDPIRVTWQNTPAWSGGERDDQNPHGGRTSLKVADLSARENVTAQCLTQVPLVPPGFKLSFWHRTARPGHHFLVTLQYYDAAGRWMSGRNLDLTINGSKKWQRFEQTIGQFPDGAQSLLVNLRATLWQDDGQPVGTVWFDDVSLIKLDDNTECLPGGAFESAEQPTPRPEFDFGRWDRAMSQAIDQLHFNTFRLDVPGLGGGTFHQRYEPELLGYGEETPQYQQAMQAYLTQLQAHLREKGWLDQSFVYWFDEPDPKDYDFVSNGFAKLKRWAPDISRMLTEQVEPALIGGPNIWCPVTSSYDHQQAIARRTAGESFWWYVCTGPKAPYCTLFIDHPATELRVWLWQTWQRQIEGILVWQTNYWTSPSAYPDRAHPQNPYADPMGWVSGYSTPSGSRRAWGNGDGRFLYPPVAAGDGHPAGPVLDGPVASLRLEMLRDGIEDYEYLAILQRLLKTHAASLPADRLAAYRQLLEVPQEITSDMTTFTPDPEPIQQRRRQVARAIAELLKSADL